MHGIIAMMFPTAFTPKGLFVCSLAIIMPLSEKQRCFSEECAFGDDDVDFVDEMRSGFAMVPAGDDVFLN